MTVVPGSWGVLNFSQSRLIILEITGSNFRGFETMALKVDWSYHRNGCKTCGKTQAFLAEHEIAVATQVDAKKTVLADPEALGLLSQVDELYATKGTKVVHVNLKQQRPDDETLLGLMIGPSGKLRAPTIKKGRTLVVGFDEATYQQVFG